MSSNLLCSTGKSRANFLFLAHQRGKAAIDLVELDLCGDQVPSFRRPWRHSDNSRGLSTRKRLLPSRCPGF